MKRAIKAAAFAQRDVYLASSIRCLVQLKN